MIIYVWIIIRGAYHNLHHKADWIERLILYIIVSRVAYYCQGRRGLIVSRQKYEFVLHIHGNISSSRIICLPYILYFYLLLLLQRYNNNFFFIKLIIITINSFSPFFRDFTSIVESNLGIYFILIYINNLYYLCVI